MIVKNSYKNKEKLPFMPYVYFIKHIQTGIWYIGSKYAKSANPSTFLKTYFTSSEIIHELLKQSELIDIEYKILKVFKTIDETVEYENRLLIKTKAVSNHMSANRDDHQQPNKTIQCNYSTRRISNPLTKKCITVKLDMPLPEGWVEGNINAKNQKRTGWKWWYNPITLESTMLAPNALIPDGWINTRPKSHSNSNSLTGKYKYITDGIETKLIPANDLIVEGWRIGRTMSESAKTNTRLSNENTKGSIFINDGTITVKLGPNLPIPEGWVKGHLTIQNKYNQRKHVQ